MEAKVNGNLQFHDGIPRLGSHHAATLRGIPHDRPVVGYGGRTINTLRLWGAASPDYFDLNEFNHGDFFGAVHDKVMAENLTRVLYSMNGALTIGTRDGATIEMAEEAGEDNFFLFGLTAEQVANSLPWYSPFWHVEHEPEARRAVDLIRSGAFDQGEPGVFVPILDALLTHGDHYMHMADLMPDAKAQEQVGALYRQPDARARKAILNVGHSGHFSSDRTIAEYAAGVWGAKPCPVD